MINSFYFQFFAGIGCTFVAGAMFGWMIAKGYFRKAKRLHSTTPLTLDRDDMAALGIAILKNKTKSECWNGWKRVLPEHSADEGLTSASDVSSMGPRTEDHAPGNPPGTNVEDDRRNHA